MNTNSACLHLSALTILVLLLHWSTTAGAAFKEDTSECRKLLDSKNYENAASLCAKAAAAGDPAAQFNLSAMYSNGWGVDKNEAELLKWLRAAADQRYPPAEYTLSSRYTAGLGVPKDGKEALRLLMDSANQEFVLAQMLLGRAYEAGYEGLGIGKDIATAIHWYRQAALQCDACQYELWRIYFFGRDVDKDPAEAARFLTRAAEAGLPKAQMQIAFRYLNGEGVAKDDVRAHMWFFIADKGGDPIATKALALSSNRLSTRQVAEAEAMARDMMKRAINSSQLCALYQQFCGR
jgi:hypothetical protein